jgi:hypothetical protein
VSERERDSERTTSGVTQTTGECERETVSKRERETVNRPNRAGDCPPPTPLANRPPNLFIKKKEREKEVRRILAGFQPDLAGIWWGIAGITV